jgi:hypothetical protein
MSWLLAVLYLVSGIVLGWGLAFFGLVRTFMSPRLRLYFFRALAKNYPEDIERAQNHVSAIRPLNSMSFDIIEFGKCNVCDLPWPLAAGKLEAHPDIGIHGTVRKPMCSGSGSSDYEKC